MEAALSWSSRNGAEVGGRVGSERPREGRNVRCLRKGQAVPGRGLPLAMVMSPGALQRATLYCDWGRGPVAGSRAGGN